MILITGAAGHVGNVLARELLARGERVRALVLPGEDCSALEGLAVERVEGNVLDAASLRTAMRGVDTVYHLAGIISIMPGRNEIMRRVNVEGTRNVARTAREAGVRRLVYTSSIHALGRPAMGTSIDEEVGFDAGNPAGEYDRTKAEGSLEVLAEVARGLDAVIVCPTGIIGPHDYRGSEMGSLLSSWMRNCPHLYVDGWFDFVDVRDIALGHILAAERGTRGRTYILAGERVSVPALLDHVREASGVHTPGFRIPARLAIAAAPLAALYARLRGTQPLFTAYSMETLLSNSRISCERARRELGYTPRPLAATLWDTVRWWREREAAASAATTARTARSAAAARAARPASAVGARRPAGAGVAVVTGASSGIGAATAKSLAALGYTVALAARRVDRLEAIAADIRAAGGQAAVIPADLASPDGPQRLFDDVAARFGAADVLVNNAGFGWYGYVDDMPAATARDMIQVNNAAMVQLSVLFLPGMKRRGRGHIINVSSVAGSIPSQGVALYSATKSFVDSFTTALHRELSGTPVHVSAVRPGPVVTEFYRTAASLSSGRSVPAERFGISATAVARAICSLLARPRRVSYVPGGLRVIPLIELGFGWIFDRIGPLLLKRQAQRA
jgi:dihydroflavonol-4-reductase